MSHDVSPIKTSQPSLDRSSTKSPLTLLDELICSGNQLTYKGGQFKDDRVVAQFVKEHRPLRTAMIGASIYLYIDPCYCCLPAHGISDFKPDITTASELIRYVKEAKDRSEAPDIIFTSLQLFDQVKESIAQISPETKLIVACDCRSDTSASDLRRRGIPAIDNDDYLRSAPLNAVIALTFFGEFVS